MSQVYCICSVIRACYAIYDSFVLLTKSTPFTTTLDLLINNQEIQEKIQYCFCKVQATFFFEVHKYCKVELFLCIKNLSIRFLKSLVFFFFGCLSGSLMYLMLPISIAQYQPLCQILTFCIFHLILLEIKLLHLKRDRY